METEQDIVANEDGIVEEQQAQPEFKAADVRCTVTGPCQRCSLQDQGEAYCAETGRRQEVTCDSDLKVSMAQAPSNDSLGQPNSVQEVAASGGGLIEINKAKAMGLNEVGGTVTYQSCQRTEEDDMLEFGLWWTAWLLIGLVACMCIRRRKLKTLTLYERRARA
eukprot:TRINITY_DN4893_c0_g1_i3.p1 TRINITY_DN4893_c0_g1~~TRINITY_DN4893_c0_g1_i3.p1  ORF type:complete len:164 (-),score=32.41 TRINITY_DN4893_c0_g1_i3:48-539(-)